MHTMRAAYACPPCCCVMTAKSVTHRNTNKLDTCLSNFSLKTPKSVLTLHHALMRNKRSTLNIAQFSWLPATARCHCNVRTSTRSECHTHSAVGWANSEGSNQSHVTLTLDGWSATISDSAE